MQYHSSQRECTLTPVGTSGTFSVTIRKLSGALGVSWRGDAASLTHLHCDVPGQPPIDRTAPIIEPFKNTAPTSFNLPAAGGTQKVHASYQTGQYRHDEHTGTITVAAVVKTPPKCTLSSTRKVSITHLSRTLATGTLPVKLTCDQAASVKLNSALNDTTRHTVHGHVTTRTVRYKLPTINTHVRAGVTSVLKLRLPIAAVKDLLQGAKESVTATVIASNANGTSRSTTTIAPLTH